MIVLDENEIGRELEFGEVVLWSGRPDAAVAARAGFGLYLFAIPWTAFALFWTWGASSPLRSNPQSGIMEWGFPAFGLPFILIGIALLSTPLWIYRDTMRTIYAVTNRRILVLKLGSQRKVHSYFRIAPNELARTERPDGSGSLTFVCQQHRDSDGEQTRQEQFIGIPNVHEVEEIIRKTFCGRGDDPSAPQGLK